MTRAKDHLQLVVPQRFFVHQQSAEGDRHVYANRTRFIPRSLERYFDQRARPVPTKVDSAGALPAHAVDLRSKMRSMWRT
jgi:DNA helicase-2/ATP-dependent DNA helicase PcrA